MSKTNLQGASEVVSNTKPLMLQSLSKMDLEIKLKLEGDAGKLRPLHGLNNYVPLQDIAMSYPVPMLDKVNALRIPYCYFHDTALENAGLDLIDVSRIFPIFSANPDDPNNYRFSANDEFLQRVVDAGANIIYRLGESIEKTKTKFRTTPPEDFDKWANICVHIIRHYNEGWANGYHWGIKDWTIWEEPNGFNGLWNSTFEEYLRLYKITSRMLRKEFPDIRIGGPETTTFGIPYFKQFLDFVKAENLPLDFVCYSGYYRMPDEFLPETFERRAMLDERGFQNVPLCINEWHASPVWDAFNDYVSYQHEVERIGGTDGAVFATTILCGLQDTPIQMACFYSTCIGGGYGMFDLDHRPAPVFYVFQKFCEMFNHSKRRIALEWEKNTENIQALASENTDGKLELLVGSYTEDRGFVRIAVPQGYYPVELSRMAEQAVTFQSLQPEEYAFQNQTLTLHKNACPTAYFIRFEAK